MFLIVHNSNQLDVKLENILLTVLQIVIKPFYSIPTIYRNVQERKIPFIKRGHHLLFIDSDIDKWLMKFYVSERNEIELASMEMKPP